MATAKQVTANRENAQKSTGPTTEAGKENSRLNRLRHGLSGHTFVLLDWESPEHFDQVKLALEAEHKPVMPTELLLVQQMVHHYWLAQRSLSLQTFAMDEEDFTDQTMKEIHNYARYHVLHQRQFQQAFAQLQKLRAEKRKAEIGFVSQKAAEAQETRRAAVETRKAEEHKITMEIKKQRSQREQSLAIMAASRPPTKCTSLSRLTGRNSPPECQI